jgi:regulator of RNase E activity RraA/CMP-N-acetylneuraminic acid synthetase
MSVCERRGVKTVRVVAFVPAKGTSERIENKNLRILDGEYLIRRKLIQLAECERIDTVYLDTESEDIAALAAGLRVEVIARPKRLASNDTDGHELFAFECSAVDADVYIQCLCTAPFVDGATIGRALDALLAHPECDSLVAIDRQKQYQWQDGRPAYGSGRIPNSVDLPWTLVEAMSLYVVRRPSGGQRPARRYGERTLLFDLSPEEALDVNWPADLELAEHVAAGRRAKENLFLTSLKPHLSSAMLSDITKEMGLSCVLDASVVLQGNVPTKIIGRAKTLELDRLTDGDEWKGIYRALDSYDFVRPQDVIVVSTKVPEAAYFGELNANLAIRSGAVGAIIDGLTRDLVAVGSLGFPVFAKGSHCRDIKYEGTLRNMNRSVTLSGNVEVSNDDIVFGDADGVIIVPRKVWPRVLTRAWETIEQEWSIRRLIAMGQDTRRIIDELGHF